MSPHYADRIALTADVTDMTDDLTRRQLIERGMYAGAAIGATGRLASLLHAMAPTHALHSRGDTWTLENAAIRAVWSTSDNRLALRQLSSPRDGTSLALPPNAFTLTLADGSRLSSSDLRVTGTPRAEAIAPVAGASRSAEQLGGQRLVVTLEDAQRRVQATWTAELRDASHYVRQSVTLRALNVPLPVRE